MDNEASDSSESSQTRYGSKKRICASLLFACIAGVGFDASPPLWIFLSPHSLSETRFLHNIQNNSKQKFFLKKKRKYPSVVDFKQN